MSYYNSSENKIRRKRISSSNIHENTLEMDIMNSRYKQNYKTSYVPENNKIERKEDRNLERKIYYKKQRRKKQRRKRIMKKCFLTCLMIAFIGTICASLFVVSAIKGAPDITKNLIEENYISKNIVSINEIPDDLKEAIVATEDRRFYKHGGVDIKSLARSVVNNILSDTTQGGSTIDMQVSKNLLTSEDKTMKRKIRDIYNAIQINRIMTKDEILEVYLNNIYFGKGSYGVADAAKTYFGKDVRDLNLSECAMLAGITNNPGKYMQHDEAKNRQKLVLTHMYEQGYIDKTQYDESMEDPTLFKSEID